MPLLSQNPKDAITQGITPSRGQLTKTPEVDSLEEVDFTKDLGRNNALPGQAYYDTSVNDRLLPDQMSRDYKADLNYGLDNLQVPGGNYGGDTMAKAIQNKYAGQTTDAVRGIKSQNSVDAQAMRSEGDTKTGQELATVRQKEVQNFNEQYAFQIQRAKIYHAWVQAKIQAENSLFGQIFGGIGSVVGASIGGAKKNK